MACIELPKDAEGREIPLNVEFLYNTSGESVKPYSFTFRRYDGFCWEMRIVGAPNLVYDPKSFYLTPPDSWEKLEEDLDRCIKADSLCAYSPSEECSTCILPRDSQCHCDSLALEAIKERIRELRGEGE